MQGAISIILAFALFVIASKTWQREAIEEWDLLKKYLSEHEDEDDLSLGDWYSLIPICRYADERRMERGSPICGNSCEEEARKIIARLNRGDEALV
jgi:hypothetical protein